MNTTHLLFSPLAKGLFHRAIAESGSCLGRIRYLRKPGIFIKTPAEEEGKEVARKLVGEKVTLNRTSPFFFKNGEVL